MQPRKLTEKDVVFVVECEPESEPIEGNCSAIDPDTDRETADWIRSELDHGNDWAWCYITVTAVWQSAAGPTWTGRDGLGGCSYRSEEDFRAPGGYFNDMKGAALADLNAQIAKAWQACESIGLTE